MEPSKIRKHIWDDGIDSHGGDGHGGDMMVMVVYVVMLPLYLVLRLKLPLVPQLGEEKLDIR